jgi:hypothetical protein
MIQERNRDEEELEAAVPQAVCSSSGLSSVINSRVTSRAGSRAASFIASGGAITPRRDLYSGVTSMKEMFDISYTVHRMAEENARRKRLKSLHRKSDTNSTTRRALFMTALQDDGSYSDDDEDNTDETSSLTDVEVDLKNDLGALKINDHSHKKRHSLFQLKIENASLLTKRKIPIPSDGQSV